MINLLFLLQKLVQITIAIIIICGVCVCICNVSFVLLLSDIIQILNSQFSSSSRLAISLPLLIFFLSVSRDFVQIGIVKAYWDKKKRINITIMILLMTNIFFFLSLFLCYAVVHILLENIFPLISTFFVLFVWRIFFVVSVLLFIFWNLSNVFVFD